MMAFANCATLSRNYYDVLGEALRANTNTLQNLAVIGEMDEDGFEYDDLGINSGLDLRSLDNLRVLVIPLTAISVPGAPALNVPPNLTQTAMNTSYPTSHE
jgi:hypothetical protein